MRVHEATTNQSLGNTFGKGAVLLAINVNLFDKSKNLIDLNPNISRPIYFNMSSLNYGFFLRTIL